MKIYVIEDNTVYNEYVCNLLKKGGFKTEQAYHLNTAKKLLTKIGDDGHRACRPAFTRG